MNLSPLRNVLWVVISVIPACKENIDSVHQRDLCVQTSSSEVAGLMAYLTAMSEAKNRHNRRTINQ